MSNELEVGGKKIRMKKIKGKEMFSLNDIADQFGTGRARDKIRDWFRSPNTLDYLGAYEERHNSKCKPRALKKLITEAKSNENYMRPEDFEIATGTPFISARNTKTGVWATFQIAGEFMMWISPKFKVWFMADYEEMKRAQLVSKLKMDKFLAQKNADNLMESLRNEQDRLESLNEEVKKLES